MFGFGRRSSNPQDAAVASPSQPPLASDKDRPPPESVSPAHDERKHSVSDHI